MSLSIGWVILGAMCAMFPVIVLWFVRMEKTEVTTGYDKKA